MAVWPGKRWIRPLYFYRFFWLGRTGTRVAKYARSWPSRNSTRSSSNALIPPEHISYDTVSQPWSWYPTGSSFFGSHCCYLGSNHATTPKTPNSVQILSRVSLAIRSRGGKIDIGLSDATGKNDADVSSLQGNTIPILNGPFHFCLGDFKFTQIVQSSKCSWCWWLGPRPGLCYH